MTISKQAVHEYDYSGQKYIELNLAHITLTSENIDEYVAYVKHKPITHLFLQSAKFEGQTLLKLLQALESNTSMRKLSILGHSLNTEHVQSVSNIIANNHQLQQLSIGVAGLGSGALATILTGIKANQSEFLEIHMPKNNFTDEDASTLIEFMNEHRNKELYYNLGDNDGISRTKQEALKKASLRRSKEIKRKTQIMQLTKQIPTAKNEELSKKYIELVQLLLPEDNVDLTHRDVQNNLGIAYRALRDLRKISEINPEQQQTVRQLDLKLNGYARDYLISKGEDQLRSIVHKSEADRQSSDLLEKWATRYTNQQLLKQYRSATPASYQAKTKESWKPGQITVRLLQDYVDPESGRAIARPFSAFFGSKNSAWISRAVTAHLGRKHPDTVTDFLREGKYKELAKEDNADIVVAALNDLLERISSNVAAEDNASLVKRIDHLITTIAPSAA